MLNISTKKGFTLIELLVVIAILAILAVAVTLALNPAELLKQARDSTRISDMAVLKSAVDLYVADVKNITWTSISNCTSGTSTAAGTLCTANATTSVDGTGWINVDLTDVSVGSPVSKLPIDPNNGVVTCGASTTSVCMYSYVSGSTAGKYKILANMESTKRSGPSGADDVESKDGGNLNDWYEVGSDMSL